MTTQQKKNPGVNEELWGMYKENPDVNTRNFIVMEYLYIVKCIAARMYGMYKNHAEQDDVISCGVIALINSVDRFDPDKNIKFETFASIRVRGAIIDFLRKQDWVSRGVRRDIKNIENAYVELQNEMGRLPTDEEVAAHLNVSMDSFHSTVANLYSANVLSLEELITNNISGIFSGDDTPEKKVEENLLAAELENAIDALSDKEKLIITLYYYENLKAKNIAQIMEVSESRVSQLHSKALFKLKTSLRSYVEN